MSIRHALGIARTPRRPTLGWDFHCHLLPGVDDGVRTLEEAKEAIAGLRALGYRGGVVTPHIYAGVYDNDSAGLRKAFEEFQSHIGSEYHLWLSAEYHATDRLFDLIAQDDLLYLSLGGGRLVLVEFPYLMPPPRGMDAIAALVRAGYQPVLAHMERYRYMQEDPKLWLSRLSRYDTWVQCNIGSLAGMYGRAAVSFSRKLLDQGVPVIWGTDLHRPRQIGRYIARGLDLLGKVGHVNAALDALVSEASAERRLP